MSEQEIEKKFTLKIRSLIVVAILLVFLCCLIPLFQISMNYNYNIKINQLNNELIDLDEEQRVLKAEIAMLKMPESLIEQVITQRIDYQYIDVNSSYIVARTD